MKQTTVATEGKGKVEEREKGWTRKPETPQKRKRASVRSFLRSVHQASAACHPASNIFIILAEISQIKVRK
jgi:hypothetical protein